MKKLVLASMLLSACTTEENLALTNPDPQSVGATRWAVRLGGTDNEDMLAAIAVDSLGDVVATGYTKSNPVDFGSGPTMVARADDNHSYITKRVASDGAERWTHMLVPTLTGSAVNAFDVAIAPGDDIVVVGVFSGTVDFGGQTLTTGARPSHIGSAFLARYAPDGELRWVNGYTLAGAMDPLAVAVASTGQIYVTGVTAPIVDGGGYDAIDGNKEMFLQVLDAAGTELSSRVFSSTEGCFPSSMAIAANGDVLIAGDFRHAAEFGGATLDGGDYGVPYLARYRSDGLYLSSHVIGGLVENSQTSWVKVAARGNEAVVQYARMQPHSLGQTYLVGLDTAGNQLWTATVASNQSSGPPNRTLATTSSDRVVTTAFNNAPANLYDPTTHHGEMEVVTFDANSDDGLANMWSTSLGDADFVDSAAGSDDSIAFGGRFSGTGDFGVTPIHTSGFLDGDIVLVAVEPAD